MVEEILRRYKKVPGGEILVELFYKQESLDQKNDKVRFVRDEVYSTLQDIVSQKRENNNEKHCFEVLSVVRVKSEGDAYIVPIATTSSPSLAIEN